MAGDKCDRQPSEAAVLIAEILELAERLRAQLDAPCAARGVSPSRLAVMAAIIDGDEQGHSQTELAARLRLSESNVSALVEGMRKSGLLFRLRSKADRRRSVLLLSEAGTELLGVLTKARDLVATSLIDGIGGETISEFRSLLKRLESQLDQSDADSTPPMATGPSTLRKAS